MAALVPFAPVKRRCFWIRPASDQSGGVCRPYLLVYANFSSDWLEYHLNVKDGASPDAVAHFQADIDADGKSIFFVPLVNEGAAAAPRAGVSGSSATLR